MSKIDILIIIPHKENSTVRVKAERNKAGKALQFFFFFFFVWSLTNDNWKQPLWSHFFAFPNLGFV